MIDMKKVLIITYYFPPSGGAGVQRILKFVKYLPEFGWEPVVLTVKEDADFPARDPSLSTEIPPGIQVYRTPIFEPYNFYRKFTGQKKESPTDIANLTQEKKGSLADRLSDGIRATFFIPDARCFWKQFAVKKGLQIIREQTMDLLFSSAPPYTCHLIANALKKKTGLPWIADFRDSWVGWLSTPSRWFLPRMMDGYFERSVLEKSDRIVTVTQGVKEDLLSRNPQINSKKWRLITNGFDSEDFKSFPKHLKDDVFTLTYTGSLYGNRNPRILIEALGALLEERAEIRKTVRLQFVGRVEDRLKKDFSHLGDVIEVIPYVPHTESIRYLLNASALLLVIDDAPQNRGILTGKLFEYIGARKPILALAPEGEAADLIRQLNVGRVVSPTDTMKVKDNLLDYYTQWKEGKLAIRPSRKAIQRLDRRVLTENLAAVFDDVVKER